jgi:hypothetical protein
MDLCPVPYIYLHDSHLADTFSRHTLIQNDLQEQLRALLKGTSTHFHLSVNGSTLLNTRLHAAYILHCLFLNNIRVSTNKPLVTFPFSISVRTNYAWGKSQQKKKDRYTVNYHTVIETCNQCAYTVPVEINTTCETTLHWGNSSKQAIWTKMLAT